jgi:type IV secretory pathway VirB2 component (pilin)
MARAISGQQGRAVKRDVSRTLGRCGTLRLVTPAPPDAVRDWRDASMQSLRPPEESRRRRGSVATLLLSIAVSIAVAAAVCAFAVLVLKLAPEWLASTPEKDHAEEIGRVRTALLAFVAGLVAVVGAVFTGLTWRLNQRGQITERFTKAVDQLGHVSPDIRQGGIYALEQIARDAPRTHHDAVVAVLTAFVREHAPWPPTDISSESNASVATAIVKRLIAGSRRPIASSRAQAARGDAEIRPAGDVQAAMTVLARRDPSRDRQVLNLGGVDLRGADLSDASFHNASFAETHLENANLIRADVRGAIFPRAYLNDASLHGARLDGASLVWAHLQSAEFWRAELRDVHWQGAHLEGAKLKKASLDVSGLYLGMPKLQWVTFSETTQWPEGFSPQDAIDLGARPIESMSADEISLAYSGRPYSLSPENVVDRKDHG